MAWRASSRCGVRAYARRRVLSMLAGSKLSAIRVSRRSWPWRRVTGTVTQVTPWAVLMRLRFCQPRSVYCTVSYRATVLQPINASQNPSQGRNGGCSM